jgi:hypothetical protein
MSPRRGPFIPLLTDADSTTTEVPRPKEARRVQHDSHKGLLMRHPPTPLVRVSRWRSFTDPNRFEYVGRGSELELADSVGELKQLSSTAYNHANRLLSLSQINAPTSSIAHL